MTGKTQPLHCGACQGGLPRQRWCCIQPQSYCHVPSGCPTFNLNTARTVHCTPSLACVWSHSPLSLSRALSLSLSLSVKKSGVPLCSRVSCCKACCSCLMGPSVSFPTPTAALPPRMATPNAPQEPYWHAPLHYKKICMHGHTSPCGSGPLRTHAYDDMDAGCVLHCGVNVHI